MSAFSTSPGTRDILAPDAARWREFQQVFATVVQDAGYCLIIPPMFEDLGVFLRLGEATEVVTKEMYDFEDKGGRRVALRPEQTASVCRAFVEHRPTTPWKVWYSGPNFRYEKPQQGRYRQFDQVGIEVLGVDDPLLDAEVISLAATFFARLGLKDVSLSVNSLGDEGDRDRYTAALKIYFSASIEQLSQESQLTLEKNPLRVLDSKRREDQALIAGAPKIRDFLSTEASTHFDAVLRALDALFVKYAIDDRLVRGLDYYRRTTFEFVSTALTAAHTAIGGGGRYDGLVEQLGGPMTPGIGFALGLDRTLLACDAEGVFAAPETSVSVFVVDTTGGMHAAEVCNILRSNGISADRAFDNRSMKAQMKAANRSGAGIAIIIGTDEVTAGNIIVRPMKSGEQHTVGRDQLVSAIQTEIQKRSL
ncbi:MAG: histidine--tRNA ligase [Actinobacteria bacterium]|nr:MAG: histidine--tRNA ligase [Actinomycetota bacterium]